MQRAVDEEENGYVSLRQTRRMSGDMGIGHTQTLIMGLTIQNSFERVSCFDISAVKILHTPSGCGRVMNTFLRIGF